MNMEMNDMLKSLEEKLAAVKEQKAKIAELEAKIAENEAKTAEMEKIKEEAIAREEAAKERIAKAEKEYAFALMWIKAKEESDRKAEEKKAAEYAKAVEAAEWRRKQNEAARAEERRWNNMTPQELEAEKAKQHEFFEEIHRERERKLLEKYGSPEAVEAFKKEQLAEIEVLKAEREERLKKEKARREEELRMIGVIK